MERKLKEVKLDSAKTFSELYGLKDQSPLIGVIDFKTAQKSPNNLEMEYGVYALYLKDVSVCSLKYGAYATIRAALWLCLLRDSEHVLIVLKRR